MVCLKKSAMLYRFCSVIYSEMSICASESCGYSLLMSVFGATVEVCLISIVLLGGCGCGWGFECEVR